VVLDRIIVKNDDGEELEFKIVDGFGVFVTEDSQRIVWPTNDAQLKLDMLKLILQ
jgi:hypothetical protein